MCNASTPSGAAIKHINLMSLTPLCFNESIAAIADPPVANIGSTTINKRSSGLLGIFTKYSCGWSVSGSRYNPTWPTLAEGIRFINPSTIPSPARRIGTNTTFLPANLLHVVFWIGVSTTTSSKGKSLVIS